VLRIAEFFLKRPNAHISAASFLSSSKMNGFVVRYTGDLFLERRQIPLFLGEEGWLR